MPKLRYALFITLLTSVIVQALSGLALWLPKPSFLGIRRMSWKTIHDYDAILIVVLVLAHIIINWGWITLITHNLLSGKSAK